MADAAIAAMQQSNPSKAPVEAGGAFEASKTAIMAIANQFQGAEVEELMISPLPNRQVVHENIADTAIAAMRQSIPSAAPIETGGAFEASKTATMAIANQFQGAEVDDLEVPPLPERVATLCAWSTRDWQHLFGKEATGRVLRPLPGMQRAAQQHPPSG